MTHWVHKNALIGWAALLMEVAVAGAVFGVFLGWLSANVDPDFRWFVYPTAFLLWLVVSVPLIFGIPLRSRRKRQRARRDGER